MEARAPQSRGGGEENVVGPPCQIRQGRAVQRGGGASKPKPALHRVLKLAIARLVPVVREKIEGRRCRAGVRWAAKTRGSVATSICARRNSRPICPAMPKSAL